MRTQTLRRATVLATCATILAACGGGGGSSGDSVPNPGDGRSTGNSLIADVLNITSHVPAAGAVQIAADSRIFLTFDAKVAQECLAEPDTWLKKNGATTPVTGSFTFENSGKTAVFTPDAPLDLESDYTVQVSALTCDEDGRLLEEDYQFEFRTLDTTPPTLTSASLGSGATNVDRRPSIALTFDEALAASSILTTNVYLRDVFGTEFALDTVLTNNVLTVTPAPDLPGSRSFILVVRGGSSGVTDRAGNALVSDFSTGFSTEADSTAPLLLSSWPQAGTGISPEVVPALQFNESVDPASVESASVVFRDEFSNQVSFTTLTSRDQRSLQLVPKTALATNRSYTIQVVSGPGAVTDVSGNTLGVQGLLQFTTGTDATAPAVLVATPTNGATSVSPNTDITLHFNDSLDPTRIDDTRFSLRTSEGTAVPASLSLEASNSLIRITPTSNLASSTTYEVRLAGGLEGIRDAAGNILASSDQSVSFTTSSDTTFPRFTIMPVDGSTLVSRDTVISVIADSQLDPASVGATAFYLQDALSNVVPGTLSLVGANRVIRFVPSSALTPGQTYVITVVGGPNGVREASGNWMQNSIVRQFRVSTNDDTTPPTLLVTVNGTNSLRNSERTLPPFGFEIDVIALDVDTYNQDLSTATLTIAGPGSLPSQSVLFATAEFSEVGATFTIPESAALDPGDYTIRATVSDLTGNSATSDPLAFRVSTPQGAELPFERTQVVWVRFDMDRDGNGRSDFMDDLIRLGLAAEGDPRALNNTMFEMMRDGILSRVHQLYLRKANGGRNGTDSVSIRFTHRQPLGVASMQIACGGFDPEGTAGRAYGADTSGTLGRAFYDYRNQLVSENNTAVNPGVGVFPAELFLYETSLHIDVYPAFVTTFAQTFLPIVPEMGGVAVGADANDPIILSPSFQFATGSSAERARYIAVMTAADEWATAIGTILAHEVGHSLGLVEPGRSSAQLHGDNSLHNEFANISDVMGSAVGYDGLVSLPYAFRDLNIAYLQHRMLLK